MNLLSILLFSLVSFLTGADSIGGRPGADLLFVGDAMQHQAQIDRAREVAPHGGYDYSTCFTHIAPAVTEADYAVVNLEVPVGRPGDYSGYPCFSAPVEFATALRDAGFDLMLTANNHTLDRRDTGLRRTLHVLDSLGVDHTGTFNNAAERDSIGPLHKTINGIRFAFLNYTYGTNGITARDGAEVSLINRPRIASEIKRARREGAEMVVVCVHWGVEYVLHENASQRDLAQFLIDQGVDMIIGSHPHVVQPMHIVRNEREGKDVLVVYSLGNFISNMKTGDTRGGALVRARVERDENGVARLKHADYDTLFSARPGGNLRNFTVIPAWMPWLIPQAQKSHYQLFERSARSLFDGYNIRVHRRHK